MVTMVPCATVTVVLCAMVTMVPSAMVAMVPSAGALWEAAGTDGCQAVLPCPEDSGAAGTHLPPPRQRVT